METSLTTWEAKERDGLLALETDEWCKKRLHLGEGRTSLKSAAILGLFLLLFSMCPAVFSQTRYGYGIPLKGVSSFYGYVDMSPYEPDTITSLDQLPEAIKKKAVEYLTGRVGADFYKRLRFHDGRAVNFTTLYKRNPEAKNYQWTVPAYVLTFKLSEPSKGIANYYAQIELDGAGKVIKEVNLPDLRKHPEKQHFFSLINAAAIAQKKGFDLQKTRPRLSYNKSLDSIVWTFEQVAKDDGLNITYRCLMIDAHNGQVIKTYQSRAIR